MILSEAELKQLPYYNTKQKVTVYYYSYATGQWVKAGYGSKVTPKVVMDPYSTQIKSREQA